MKGRLLRILSAVVIAPILATSVFFAKDVKAATKTYNGTIKEYTYTPTLDTGKFFEPSADGKYPLMIYFHGA
ncbi:MAG: hypothetical protein J6U54_21215, partial [Clostridiales bacterium]|nr:hypothetical protein [Clostridiales bacterium]